MRGVASTRLAEAASSFGQEWFPQPKFMKPAKRKHPDSAFPCTASCMLGCRCGAKWNAAEWVDEALQLGAHIRKGARVRSVRIENGRVTGVRGTLWGRPFTARAGIVVLCAGGLGSPRILQQSGFHRAGVGMAMDTTLMVYGFSRYPGTGKEPPMTWSYENMDIGYMLSTLTDPWLLYPLIAARKGLAPLLRWAEWDRMLGLMIKLKDDISGGVFPNGRISKPLTPGDSKRLQFAYEDCRRILLKAGARASTIFMTPLRGTHPSGTVRVGKMLDNRLETEVEGLYVCDASVFPESLDRPTVLTIIGLARRLANDLLSRG
jgi:choline dehydrogenase-like flavoprotein